MPGELLAFGAGRAELQGHQLGTLEFTRAKHCDLRERAADHRNFVAGIKTWAGLAIFVDLIGHCVTLSDAESEVFEEVWNACEQAYRKDRVLLGLFHKGVQDKSAGTLAFCFGLHYD